MNSTIYFGIKWKAIAVLYTKTQSSINQLFVIMKYAHFLILLFCSFSLLSIAQEQLGLRTENYSGINSVFANPANNLTTPFQWDVNLGAVGGFVDNTIGGYRDASVSDVLNNVDRLFLATDFPSDQEFPADATVFDFAPLGKDKFASAVTIVTGPAIMLNFEKHSFGVFTNFRAVVSGHKIPAVLGYYDYESIRPGDNYSVFPSNVGGMAWGEIGINYLYKGEANNGQIGIGFNLKYLQGFESFFVKNNTNLNITKLERDVLNFENGANINVGFTATSIDEEAVNLQQNGTGFGLDIGLTFAALDYQDGAGIKLGVSILDIGKIKFTKNTEAHTIDIGNPFSFDPKNLRDVTNFRDGLDQLNEELFGTTGVSLTGDTYEMWLPSAFSLQADLAIRENIYVNATVVQRIPIGEISVERGNLFALTPRYESRWVSAFLPVSVYNWQHFQVGAAARLAFLTFGTENLGSFFGNKSLTGTDFYMAIKINPFRMGWKNGGGGRKSKAVQCYEF